MIERNNSGGSLFLAVAFYHAPVTTLGPGRRVGLWLSGCRRRCQGCISPELWKQRAEDFIAVEDVYEELVNLFKQTGAVGLTVSGGEPLEQAEALEKLLRLVSKQNLTGDVLLYTGFAGDELVNWPWLKELVTVLVDGPFTLGWETGAGWSGSGGQGLHIFKPSYLSSYAAWQNQPGGRCLQMVKTGGRLRLLGIPRQGDLDILNKALAASFDGVFSQEIN